MILHNLCIDLNDHPVHLPLFAEIPAPAADELDADLSELGCPVDVGNVELPEWETDEWLREAGRLKRLQLLDMLFPL